MRDVKICWLPMVGTRGRLAALTAIVAAAFLGAVTLALGAPAARAAAGNDRAATHAYLAATVGLDEALLANMPASSAAGEAVAARLQRECPGVLSAPAGAPRAPGAVKGKPSPRQRGETARMFQQLTALRFELADTLLYAVYAPDRTAVAAYAQTIRNLRWGEPRLAEAVAGAAAFVEEELGGGGSAHDLCGDIRFWIASGYRALAPGTKEAGEQLSRIIGAALGGVLEPSAESLAALLERSAGPAERALTARISLLNYRLESLPVPHDAEIRTVQGALGFPPNSSRAAAKNRARGARWAAARRSRAASTSCAENVPGAATEVVARRSNTARPQIWRERSAPSRPRRGAAARCRRPRAARRSSAAKPAS